MLRPPFFAPLALTLMHLDRWLHFADIPEISGLHVPTGHGLRINCHLPDPHQPAPADSPQVRAAWVAALADNPDLFDGHILTVHSITSTDHLAIDVRPDRFSRLLAQQRGVGSGLCLLGCKGVITGVDAQGAEHVLLGRRGQYTRIYAGQWELAPAGGVDLPPGLPKALGLPDLVGTLLEEGQHELGINLAERVDASLASLVGAVHDRVAASLDLFVAMPWQGLIDPRRGWCSAAGCDREYIDVCWVSRGHLAEWFNASATGPDGPISPPTRAAMRLLGWRGGHR